MIFRSLELKRLVFKSLETEKQKLEEELARKAPEELRLFLERPGEWRGGTPRSALVGGSARASDSSVSVLAVVLELGMGLWVAMSIAS